VGGGREAAHIVAQFSHDLLGAPSSDAGDGVESFNGLGERARLLFDAGIEQRDLSVEELHVIEQTLQQEDVMVRNTTPQRLPQLCRLFPQEAARQVGESLGIAFAGDQGLEHRPAGGAENITRHIAQLESIVKTRPSGSGCPPRVPRPHDIIA
jgi:hypothetical protein